jgi:hypothetical protein
VPRPTIVGVVLLACAGFIAGGSAAQETGPTPAAVRSTSRWGLELIDDGCRRSPSFRELVTAISLARLVVYVERADRLDGEMIGATELLATTGGYRYVRVSIDFRASRKHLIAILGHELQHAREIGDDPSVVDQAGVEALYRRIGDLSVDGFDSQAARDMGRRVWAELWGETLPAGRAAVPAVPAAFPVTRN